MQLPAPVMWTVKPVTLQLPLAPSVTVSGELVLAFTMKSGSPKVAADSYRRIASEVDCEAPRMLFLSDALSELDAARSAGYQALLAVRPGNQPQTVGPPAGAIHSFDQIA